MFANRACHANSGTFVLSCLREHERWSWIVGPFSVRKNLCSNVILVIFVHRNQASCTLWPNIGSCIIWYLLFFLPHACGISNVIIWILQNSRFQEILISRFIEVILVHVYEFFISLNLTLQFTFHLILLFFFYLLFLLRCELRHLWISLISLNMWLRHILVNFIMMLFVTLITLP
jgi:hypothetical protein